ncbi:hypothetical protein L1887_26269 [Cichorium endivia]|nr:hypothetical protein L1887_26269 [Cichorium endivia]
MTLHLETSIGNIRLKDQIENRYEFPGHPLQSTDSAGCDFDSLLLHLRPVKHALVLSTLMGPRILKPHQLMAEFDAISKEDTKLHDGAFHEVLKSTQEAIVLPPWVALSIRLRPSIWNI